MLLLHVTKDGKCAYCSANLVLCPECNEFFHAKNKGHKICLPRCKMRRYRRNKKPA